MIRAAIFDMDGLLIDSEPFWQQAELEGFGVAGLTLSQRDLSQTVGMRIDEVVTYWLDRRPWDIDKHPPGGVQDRIVDRVIRLVEERGEPMPGVLSALTLCEDLGLRLAVASSSSLRIIEAVLCRLELRQRFEVVQSAEHEPRGKPDPAVFLSAARALGLPPASCVALEDSIMGLLAAGAASMRCIIVPDPRLRHDPALTEADVVLDTLAGLDAEALGVTVGSSG